MKRKDAAQRQFRLSGAALKWMGFVLLCFGSVSIAVIQRGILDLTNQTAQSLNDAMGSDRSVLGWVIAAFSLSLMSAIALPFYPRLLCQGWQRSANRTRYCLRIALCALVSEIPYDLCFSGTWLNLSQQNPVWALAVSAILLAVLDYVRGRPMAVLLQIAAVLSACIWALLLRSNLGMLTVLLTACFRFLRDYPQARLWIGFGICLAHFPSPVGMVLVHFYGEEKGADPGKRFYFLYPAQLLAAWCAGLLLA